MERKIPLGVFFFRTETGHEPVREWLKSLAKPDRSTVGTDLWKAQAEWPVGLPHVRALGKGLYEVRSNLRDVIARVIFCIDSEVMVLLHGFIKKTQKTPGDDLELAQKRRRIYEQG